MSKDIRLLEYSAYLWGLVLTTPSQESTDNIWTLPFFLAWLKMRGYERIVHLRTARIQGCLARREGENGSKEEFYIGSDYAKRCIVHYVITNSDGSQERHTFPFVHLERLVAAEMDTTIKILLNCGEVYNKERKRKQLGLQ